MDPIASIPPFPYSYPITQAQPNPQTASQAAASLFPAPDQVILSDASQYSALSSGVYSPASPTSASSTSTGIDPGLLALMQTDPTLAQEVAANTTQPAAPAATAQTPALTPAGTTVSPAAQVDLAAAAAESQTVATLMGGFGSAPTTGFSDPTQALDGLSTSYSALEGVL